MIQNKALAGASQLEPGATNALFDQVDVIGNPNQTAQEVNTYGLDCRAFQTDATTGWGTVVWKNTQADTSLAPTWVVDSGAAGTVQTEKVSIASAAVLTLNSVPVTLLPAAPAGTVYQLLAVTGRMNFLTAAYATNTELDIIDEMTGNKLFGDTSTLLAATSTTIADIPAEINSNAGIAVTEAGAVQAKVATGDPTAGAGSLDIYVTYRLITL